MVEAAHKRNRKRQHHKKKKQEMTLAHGSAHRKMMTARELATDRPKKS